MQWVNWSLSFGINGDKKSLQFDVHSRSLKYVCMCLHNPLNPGRRLDSGIMLCLSPPCSTTSWELIRLEPFSASDCLAYTFCHLLRLYSLEVCTLRSCVQAWAVSGQPGGSFLPPHSEDVEQVGSVAWFWAHLGNAAGPPGGKDLLCSFHPSPVVSIPGRLWRGNFSTEPWPAVGFLPRPFTGDRMVAGPL